MGKGRQSFKNSKKIEDVESHGAEEAASFHLAQPILGCEVPATESGSFVDEKAQGSIKARNSMDLTVVVWRSSA